MYNEIEKMFKDEVREKKVTARGCYAMKGKRGIIKKMVTPLDFMSKKEKKEYIKGGLIEVSNMYSDITQIPTVAELKEKIKKDKAGAKKTLEIILDLHKPLKLQKQWGLTRYEYYNFLNTAGFDYQYGKTKAKSKNNKVIVKPEIETDIIQAQQNLYNEALMFQNIHNQQNIISVNEAETIDLFKMEYKQNQINGDIAADRITTLLSVLNYKKNYKIKLVIEELPDPE